MFTKRLFSGIVLLVAAIFLLYIGGTPLLVVTGVLALMGQYEFYRAIGIDHKGFTGIGYFMTVLYYVLLNFEGMAFMTAVVVITLLLLMTAYVITYPEYRTEEVTGAFFGLCYVSVLMSFIYLTREHTDGIFFVWLILLSSWGSDTLAYCTGKLTGRHKMAPKLSPKKTWEGAAGGVLGAALLGLIYGMIFGSRMLDTQYPQFTCALACGFGAVVSMLGDLAASAIKRNYNIKDYSQLIPGHGGVLDRFDSVMFTAPAIYYAIVLVERYTLL